MMKQTKFITKIIGLSLCVIFLSNLSCNDPKAKSNTTSEVSPLFFKLSLALGRNEGRTKILFDKDTKRTIGVGIVGPNAGDLISEGALAIEMGADAEDISLTVHPHPTLGETFANAAEVFEGTVTDLYIPKKTR